MYLILCVVVVVYGLYCLWFIVFGVLFCMHCFFLLWVEVVCCLFVSSVLIGVVVFGFVLVCLLVADCVLVVF